MHSRIKHSGSPLHCRKTFREEARAKSTVCHRIYASRIRLPGDQTGLPAVKLLYRRYFSNVSFFRGHSSRMMSKILTPWFSPMRESEAS